MRLSSQASPGANIHAPPGDALENPFKSTIYDLLNQSWGRPGFDVGCKAAWGIPRTSYLVNPTGNAIVANDDNYALAA